MIEARELHKKFGRITALQALSFRAADGRITGLLGPNGAGKSTTIKMMIHIIPDDFFGGGMPMLGSLN